MSNLLIALGFDCDRPRGSFIETPDGLEIAVKKIESIKRISLILNELKVPRTFFICGMFLESMCSVYGETAIADAFESNNELVEVGDHTYSHQVLKRIPTRPDKNPLDIQEISKEYYINTLLFNRIFGRDLTKRGFRVPLGHFQGLSDCPDIVDILLNLGVNYISSDLRDAQNSICPELILPKGVVRQPYFYRNGLLEIPSTGWHDTAFSGTTKTQLFQDPPANYSSIIEYFKGLFNQASNLAIKNKHTYYLALVLHPYDLSIYDKDGIFFRDLFGLLSDLGGSFIRYEDIKSQICQNNGND